MGAGTRIVVEPESCYLCGVCVSVCPKDAIVIRNDAWNFIGEKCVGCAFCVESCPVGALEILKGDKA